MTFPLLPVSQLARTSKSLALTLLPHGGQGTVRRNAWSAMSADATQARSRREAAAAVAQAQARTHADRLAR